MSKKYKIVVNSGKSENNQTLDAAQGQGDRGQPLRIKAQPGTKYQLQEIGKDKNTAPEYVKVKRVGKNLHIVFEGGNQSDVIIEDYYDVMPEGYNGLVGETHTGNFYEYIPEDPDPKGLIPQLADGGQYVSVALGGAEVVGSGAAVAVLAFNPLLAALGLAGAGAAAVAAQAGTAGATSLVIEPVTADNTLTAQEAQSPNTVVSGRVSGVFAAGDQVTLVINGKNFTGLVNAAGEFSIPVPTADLLADSDKQIAGSVQTGTTGAVNASAVQNYVVDLLAPTIGSVTDNVGNPNDAVVNLTSNGFSNDPTPTLSGLTNPGAVVTIRDGNTVLGTVAAGPNGAWSYTPTTPLGEGAHNLTAATTVDGVTNTSPPFVVNVDTKPPVATVTVDNLSPDNLISGEEVALDSLPVTGKVSGEFRPGDVVTVTVNGKPFTGAVDAQGIFSVKVPMADLKADPDTQFEVSAAVTDAAGNTVNVPGKLDYNVQGTVPNSGVSISLNPVLGDNIITPTEGAQATANLTGKVTGAFTAGDTVTLTLNNKALTTSVNAQGEYTFSAVSMADLKADTDTQADVSVAAKNPQGGLISIASNSQNYMVETTANTGTAITIAVVTADNIVNIAESQNTSTPITGKVSGVFATGDKVTLQINDKSFTGVVDSGGNYSINVPTTDLLADADTQITATVVNAGGLGFSATQKYGVDITPPLAAVTVNNITPDNLISAEEAGQATLPVTGKVIGEFRPGDVVTVSVHGKPFTGTVDSQGNFSVNVPTADLLADPDTLLDVTVAVTDTVGNTTSVTAPKDYGSTAVPPSNEVAISLNPVTGDNIISPSEGQADAIALNGKVTGAFTVGDVVTLSLNGKTQTTQVNAQGEYSFIVNMVDLKADPDTQVEVSILAKKSGTGQTSTAASSQDYAVETTPGTATALVVNPVTSDNILSKTEAQSPNTVVTGKVTGVFAAGDKVTLQVNDKTFTGSVDAQGSFSVNVPTTDLVADGDTQINASVAATTPAGTVTATAVQNYGVDITPPVASVTVDNITPDNLITAQEAGQATLPVSGKVTGEFRPGDVATVSVNDKTFTAAVDAQGNFSVNVPMVDLLADPDTQVEVSVAVTDGAGNTTNTPAVKDYNASVNPGTTAAITLNPVTGDNIISPTEGSQTSVNLTGKVTGPFTAGDAVTVNLNNKTVAGTVNAAGEFTVSVTMADLKADADKTVQVSVLAKDPITGQLQSTQNSQTYAVESLPTTGTALVVNPVTADNLLNKTEAQSPNTAVTGKVTGVFAAGDKVTLQVNDKTFTGSVDAQGSFSVNVPTTDLLADGDTQINASVAATTPAGTVTATAVQNYGVDITPPVASVTVNNITPDNLISAQEAGQTTMPVSGKVSGEFRPGDVVTVKIHGQTFTAPVDSQGNFSVNVPTTDLLADPDTQLEVSVAVTDGAGNTAEALAVKDYAAASVNPGTTAAVTLNPVTGDNIISPTEGNQTTVSLTGKVTGPYTAGDVATINLHNSTVTAAVNAAGEFTVNVNMADLKADADKTLQVSVVAKDPITGQTQVANNSQTYTVETAPQTGTALVVNPLTADNILSKTEAQSPNTAVTGKVTGVFAAGDKVTLQVNDKTFTGSVDAQGSFSVKVPTTDLVADGDTQINASVAATTPAGTVTANAVQNYGVDITPPVASVAVDNITSDNLITAQEAGQATLPVSGKVTGEFRPGDVATVSVNGKTFTAAVDAQGNFSVNVPMVDLLADPDTQVEVSVAVTDGAGNTTNTPAVKDYNASVNPGTTAAITLNPVTGDNIISPSEGSQTSVNLTGKVTGPFTAGDAVTVNLNNKTVAGTVNAAGEFTVSVTMADLKADADKTVQVSVLAKDPITGQLQSTQNSQTYAVESLPTTGTALVVNPVTADNLLNKTEAQSPNTAVTGKVTGVFAAGDKVTLQVNDKTFTGSVDAQGNFSVNVPTTDLLADGDTQINASVAATTPAGTVTANAVQNYGVDITPPVASVTVNNITPDNLISAQEAGQTTMPVSGKVSGEFRPGDVATVSVNDKTFTAAVDAQGSFSVNVPTADLLADPDTQVEVSVAVTDGAGNSSNVTDSVDYNTQVQGNAPVNTVPGLQTTLEDINKVITGLQVSDTDAGTSTMTVTLSVTNGAITLLPSDGVSIATNNTGSVQLTGTLSAINALLAAQNAVTYKPGANYSGTATLTMTSSDGTLSDSDTVTVNIAAVNDAPTGASNTITLLEGSSKTFSAADFGFADALDTPANSLKAVIITALPLAGTLKLSGLNVEAGQSISAADLANLVFTPAPNANGTGYASIGFKVQDNGGTANAGSDTSTNANTLTFNVTDVNPVTVVINEPVVQNDNGTLTVSGTGLKGALVQVTSVNGALLGTATVQDNGTWSLVSAGPVPEGTLTANASLNGDTATDTAPYVDNKPPAVNINEPVTQNPNGTLTVSGTSEPGATIKVTGYAGVEVGTTIVLQNGTWSVTSKVPVKQGELTAAATDINSEVATDTAPYVDNKPPVVQITEPVFQNTNGTLLVEGTSEPGATIVVKDVNNAIIGTTTVLVNGTWKLTSAGTVPFGTLTATATDINANVATDTAPYADGLDISNLDAKDTDGDGKPTVSGVINKPNQVVTITDPEGKTHTTMAGPDGKFSLELPAAPTPLEGPYTATAVNGADSATESVTETDLTAPVVTNVDVVDTDGDGKPTVTGQTDPNLVVTITDPEGKTHTVAAGPDGKFSVEIDPAPSPLTGNYTVTAVDPAGNTSAPVTVNETDLLAPVITNLDAKDTDGDGKPTVSGKVDEPNLVVTITDPEGKTHTVLAGPNGEFSIELDPAPNPVLGNYTATTVDAAGNVSAPVTINETDLTAPVITNLDVKDTDGDGKPTVTGQVNEPNLVVTITDPDGITHTVTAGPDGKFSLELDPAPLQLLGTYTAITVDGANVLSLPVSVMETDLTAPVVTNVDVVDTDGDGKPTVTGQTDPNLVVTITDPEGKTHTVAAGPDGKFSVEIDPAPSPLTGNYTVTAVDPAGNTSAPVTVNETDLLAPVITNLDAKDTDGDGKPTVSGVVDTPNVKVTITDPEGKTHTTMAGPDGKFSLELPAAPTQLQGTYTAKAVDGAGNTSAPVSVTETDLTAPVVTNVVVGDPDGDGKPSVSGKVDEPNAVVTITDPAGGTHTVTAGPDGVFTVEIDPAPSTIIGTYGVTAVDPAGNTSAPVTGQLGSAIPVNINEPLTQNPSGTITVTGTGEEGATIEVKDVNNVLIGTVTVVNGIWSLDSAGEVPAGQLTATSTNLNNQVTSDSAPYNNTPLAVLDEAQGTEDSTLLSGNVSTNDTHKDGTETYELTSLPTGTHGTLAFSPDGGWTYTRTADLNPIQTAALETFTYKVKDSAGKETTAQLKISLTPVNDAPVVTRDSIDYVLYTENGAPVAAMTAPIRVSDVDSANLQGATVRVGSFTNPNPFMVGDVLTFTLPPGSNISGNYNNTTGVLTFTGVATVAEYQDALNAVKYHHTRDDYATDTTRKVFWSVTDESGQTNVGSSPYTWIAVKKLNDSPVLPDANLVLPSIQPLTSLLLPTDENRYALGVSANTLVTGVTDADVVNVVNGVAIIGVNTAMGTLYLSGDGGVTWTTPAFEVSSGNAILLKGQANKRIYFQPHVGVEGTIADALTIRAWDTTNNEPESVLGMQVQGYNITAVGGSTAFSSTTDTVSLTVATLASSPAYNGTAGDDVINGSVGSDVILAKGGIDQINADDGNDKIVVNDSNVQSLPAVNAANFDGGAGINTLKLTVANTLLDLTNVTVQGKVNHFSVLDITGNGNNTLKINLQNVQTLSGAQDNLATADADESKMLVVQAGSGDAVSLQNTLNWATLSGLGGDSLTTLYGSEYGFIADHKYTQFSQSGATLFVDELAPVADIVGTSGDDTLTGLANDEVIFGNGGVDQINAAAGNDTVILNGNSVATLANANTAQVDGGAGVNALQISGVNVNMDLTNTTVAGKVHNFSVLDLGVGNGNKVKLGLQQVLDLSTDLPDNPATTDADESKMVVVHGTSLNTVQLVDSVNWTAVTNLGGTALQNNFGAQFGFEPGRSYTQYTHAGSSASLFIDQMLTQDLL
ncbi:Ig-like domain-containing protein [Limnohabitans sp. 2KL-1]|uniref:Ig-like domain-containing protein n=1 Tax=Limnohabitans sp. 2KL-1 TaxID=1100699 RepID=UPI001304A0E1|nr:Ig-like domain-containing protein [Limnohabitans sp. 2KL-1]